MQGPGGEGRRDVSLRSPSEGLGEVGRTDECGREPLRQRRKELVLRHVDLRRQRARPRVRHVAGEVAKARRDDVEEERSTREMSTDDGEGARGQDRGDGRRCTTSLSGEKLKASWSRG